MTLMLDQRRQAMLKAGGVELWWMRPPAPESAPKVAFVPQMDAPSHRESAEQPVPSASVRPAPNAQTPVEPTTIAVQSPEAKPQPVQSSHVPEVGAEQSRAAADAMIGFSTAAVQINPAMVPNEEPKWLILTDQFTDLGEAAVAAEQLLQNMLRAMQLLESPQVWRASMVSGSAAHNTAVAPNAEVLHHPLESVVRGLAPRMVIAMGRVAAQTFLGNGQPLGVLRGHPHERWGARVIATYSPSYLLRSPHAKAGAWADLRLALHLFNAAQN